MRLTKKSKITRILTTDEVVKEYERYAESQRRLRKVVMKKSHLKNLTY